MYILGINAYHANASAALVADGQLVAAVEEERFNRVKYAAGFPVQAIRYCLAQAGITLAQVDHVAIPRDPRARLGTKLLYSLRMPSFALERIAVMKRFAGVKEELAQAFDLDPETLRSKFHRVEHHQAHSASAFFVSPFDDAAVLSADGLGDFASTMWSAGHGPRLEILGSIAFPHSLGIYYSALTQYIGFWKFGDEYKVMGLAAYGQPAYLDEFRKILKTTRRRGRIPPWLGIFLPPAEGSRDDLAGSGSNSGAGPPVFGVSGETPRANTPCRRAGGTTASRSCRNDASGAGRNLFNDARFAAAADQAEKSVPRRRRGVQLRR